MAFVAKELRRCGETRARAATVDPDGRVPTTEAGSEPSAQEVVECPSRAAGVGLEQFNEGEGAVAARRDEEVLPVRRAQDGVEALSA
jgi:hypothetical protein